MPTDDGNTSSPASASADDVGIRTRLPRGGGDRSWLTVTSPLLPDFEAIAPMLRDVLDRRWVTNQGHYVQALEARLRAWMGVDGLVLVTNGTVALEMAYAEVIPAGEVICTAFSFPATWNPLYDNDRWTPVIVDTLPNYRIDPAAVEAAITPRTTGIVAVHSYGFPCDNVALAAIAEKHGLALVYDAAHCFGVQQDGRSLGTWGTLSTFSFHATKVFNTLEGGAITGTATQMDGLVQRRNFGLKDGQQVGLGTNGKVDEFRAVVGLANLDQVEGAIAARGRVAHSYLEQLPALGIDELVLHPDEFERAGYTPNYAYFPVRVRPAGRRDRTTLQTVLKAHGILARPYFFPTIANTPLFAEHVDVDSIPEAISASEQVLCLPIHHLMSPADVALVVSVVGKAFGGRGRP